MAFPQNHRTRSLGLSLFLLVRANPDQCSLSNSKITPQRIEPNALVLYLARPGGRWDVQCQILSRAEAFWLIATVRGGEYFRLPNSFLPKRKFEKLSISKNSPFQWLSKKIHSRVIIPTHLAEQNQSFISCLILETVLVSRGTHDNSLSSLLRTHGIPLGLSERPAQRSSQHRTLKKTKKSKKSGRGENNNNNNNTSFSRNLPPQMNFPWLYQHFPNTVGFTIWHWLAAHFVEFGAPRTDMHDGGGAAVHSVTAVPPQRLRQCPAHTSDSTPDR